MKLATLFFTLLAIVLLSKESLSLYVDIRVPNSTVTNSSKAGLAWPNGDFVNYTQYTTTGKVSWYYTWSPSPINSTLEFVPMLWGTTQIDAFQKTINDTIKNNNVTAVLGMNEPQQSGQSSLTPQQGADIWKTYIEPLKKQGLRLGTPAPSSAPSGKTWIQEWLTACAGGCNPDFIALHWYDVNATQFQLYLEDFHNTFNLPLWVTEWDCQNFNGGPQCTKMEIIEFLNQTQSFMDSVEWVERYAWFGVMENLQGVNPANAMMTSAGVINALGQQYIGVQSANVTLSMSSSSSEGVRACIQPVGCIIVALITLFSQ